MREFELSIFNHLIRVALMIFAFTSRRGVKARRRVLVFNSFSLSRELKFEFRFRNDLCLRTLTTVSQQWTLKLA